MTGRNPGEIADVVVLTGLIKMSDAGLGFLLSIPPYVGDDVNRTLIRGEG